MLILLHEGCEYEVMTSKELASLSVMSSSSTDCRRPSLIGLALKKGLDASSPNGKMRRKTNTSDDVRVARGMKLLVLFHCKSIEAVPILNTV